MRERQDEAVSDIRLFQSYVGGHLDSAIQELVRYCAQPSVSATGEGVEQCADLVREMLLSRGFEAEIRHTPGHPIVLGRAPGRNMERAILFYCHYDVQPPDPLDLWQTPPFEPDLRDGAVYARGAYDDKGELIARLLGLDALRSIDGQYPCQIVFLVEGEEEIGSGNLGTFVDKHFGDLDCQGAIWEGGSVDSDGHPTLRLGSRGTLYVEVSVRSLSVDAHSGHANTLPSAAWQLTWALAALKDRHEIVTIPRFYDDVRAPTQLEMELAARLIDESETLKSQHGVTELLNSASDIGPQLAHFRPTCNVNGITTGYQGAGMKTIIPAVASAKIDFRLVPDQDPLDILKGLRKYLDGLGFQNLDIEVLEADPPGQTALDAELVTMWSETAEDVYQLSAKIQPLSSGTTPLHFFTARGIPVVEVGCGYDGGAGNFAHGPNEHVRIRDIGLAAVHAAHLTTRFAS